LHKEISRRDALLGIGFENLQIELPHGGEPKRIKFEGRPITVQL
jgi:hypothetical protein